MSARSPDLPLPPRALASRVYAVHEGSDADAAYLELGEQTKRQIVELLPDDWSFEGKRVLDFGSGAGRTLRHFAGEAESAEFWGCDIDGPSIEWMQKSLCPPFHARQTISVPPLALEHRSFDLIYAVSVFTHLTDTSTRWLLELHRTLKPDGLLIATFMGRWTSEWFAKEPWVEDRVGKNVLYHHRDWDSGGPAVLISEWWLREHWGRAFQVVHIASEFQNYSWAVLRKRDVNVIRTNSTDLPRIRARWLRSGTTFANCSARSSPSSSPIACAMSAARRPSATPPRAPRADRDAGGVDQLAGDEATPSCRQRAATPQRQACRRGRIQG